MKIISTKGLYILLLMKDMVPPRSVVVCNFNYNR